MPSLRDGQEVFLGVIPFFHVYGMTACMNLAIATGGAMVLLPRFVTKDVLHAVVKSRTTIFIGVQAMYVAINNFPDVGRYDLSSIRICISGAGPLHSEVQERFEALTGGKVVEGFGLSEASPVTHVTPIFGRRKKGTIGLPLPDTDARVVDVESGTRELPAGEAGELIVKGPQVMKGYWRRPEESAAALRDGWLHTGDIATVDDDGYFAIVDRKKDMIKTKGENVYPREVEEVLFRHPKIKDAVVVGVPEEFMGEMIKAYVVLKDGETATENEIIEYCGRDLAKFKIPKAVEFRPELPRTMVGKVLRRVLLDEELKKRHATVG
jgi:long-chain acyl-CoA synthetase